MKPAMVILVLSALVAIVPAAAFAQETSLPPPPSPSSLLAQSKDLPVPDNSGHEKPAIKEITEPPSTCIFCRAYAESLLADSKHIAMFPSYWDLRDWLEFGGFMTGTGLMMAYGDRPLEKDIHPKHSDATSTAATVIQPFGLQYNFAIIGGIYFVSAFTHNTEGKLVTLDCLSASLITWGIIGGLSKEAVGRARPSQGLGPHDFDPFEGQTSFPSGHTTQAFTLATVLSTHYKTPWVYVPAYGIASLVGLARMNKNAHWASDVIAGAALGTVVGREVVHFNRKERARLARHHLEHEQRRHIAFFPTIDSGGGGLNLIIAD